MQSSSPIPGNPWPHGMVIRVDQPHQLLTLLFIQAAWGLPVLVPALDPEPAVGTSAMPPSASREEWAATWSAAWTDAWRWIAEGGDERLRTALQQLPTGAPGEGWGSRDPGLAALFPPMWETEHGAEGLDREAMNAWERSLQSFPPGALAAQAERRSLPAMIAAWESGIDSIIELPYRGHHAERFGRHLVVSRVTRATPELYEHALTIAAGRS